MRSEFEVRRVYAEQVDTHRLVDALFRLLSSRPRGGDARWKTR